MKRIFSKIKIHLTEYLNREFIKLVTCCPQEKITKEEAEELYYIIDHYEEITEQYGSIKRWKKYNKKLKKQEN